MKLITTFIHLASSGKMVANGGVYTAFLMYVQKKKKSQGELGWMNKRVKW